MMRTVTKILLLFLSVHSATFALPNPAATNCLNKGNRYILIQNIGVCIFPDLSYCEEWAYFRGQCKPGQNQAVVESKALQSRAPTSNNMNLTQPSS